MVTAFPRCINLFGELTTALLHGSRQFLVDLVRSVQGEASFYCICVWVINTFHERPHLAPKLAPDRLAQHGTERDDGSIEGPEGRRKPHFPVRDGTGRDGAKRISRPPRSTAPAPLRPSGGNGLAARQGERKRTVGPN